MRSENERSCSVACLESSSFDESVVNRNFRVHRLIHLFTEDIKFGSCSEESAKDPLSDTCIEDLRRLILL
jgi:hypothetical protein